MNDSEKKLKQAKEEFRQADADLSVVSARWIESYATIDKEKFDTDFCAARKKAIDALYNVLEIKDEIALYGAIRVK